MLRKCASLRKAQMNIFEVEIELFVYGFTYVFSSSG